jgi:hypothetical protein
MRVSGMRHYPGGKGGREQCMYLERTRMIDGLMPFLFVLLNDFPQRIKMSF